MAGEVQNSVLVPLLNIICKLKISALKPPHRKALKRYVPFYGRAILQDHRQNF